MVMPRRIHQVVCRHCPRRCTVYSRGLCRDCWADVAVRSLYDVKTGKNRGTGCHDRITAPLPAAGTEALPGSEEKILVMIQRASDGRSIFHPDDPVVRWGTTSVTRSSVFSVRGALGPKYRQLLEGGGL